MEIKPNIELSIDELVLHGFSPADKFRIGQAVENELMMLLNQQGVPPSLKNSSSQPVLNGGSFQMNANSPAATVGSQIAGAVYSSFNTE